MNQMYLRRKLLMLLAFCSIAAGVRAQGVRGRVTDGGNGSSLAGVTVVVVGTKTGATTNGNGDYTLSLSPGDYSLTFSFIGYDKQTVRATVSGSDMTELNVSLRESSSSLSEVLVVGSRSTQVRTSTETVAPIDVIQSGDLIATGQVEPTQQLNFVAPSFNSSRQTVADGTDHIDPATIRGLGPDQVLVLLNGKRRHNQALVNVNGTIGRGSVGTDLNALPAAALERVEVLRDGAASQYGSDAIAGVINLVLRKKVGTTVNAQAGQQYAGDGRVFQVGVNHGLRIGQKGTLNLTLEGRTRGATNRAGTYNGPVYFNWYSNGTVNEGLRTRDEQRIRERGFSREDNMQIGNSKVDNIAGFANLSLPINNRVEFYANGGVNFRQGEAAGFYRYTWQNTQMDTTMYPNGFLPQIHSNIRDYSAMTGLTGKTAGGLNWDVSAVYGGNSFRFDVKNSLNASLARATTLPNRTQREFYAGTIVFNQFTFDAGAAQDFGNQLGLKSFNVAAGLSYRIDNYQIQQGEEASWQNYNQPGARVQFAAGAQVFPGFQPANAVNENRNVFAGYVDVETDLTESILLNGAARYENYSDFGGNLATKLAARFKLDDAFSIRGGISTGFRAPSIHQYFFSNVSTQFVNVAGTLTPLQVGTFRNGSAIANSFGIPELKAERSVNYSVGITSRPVDNISITVDLYQIEIKDRIVLTGQFVRGNSPSGLVVAGLLDAAGARDVNAAAFFTNAIDTRTQGLDVVVSTSPRLNTGKLDLTLAANFNRTRITELRGTSRIPNDATFGNTLFNPQQRGFVELANPQSKITLGANYQIGKMRLTARTTRFGRVETRDPNGNAALNETFAPRLVTDLSVGYALTKNLTLALGANNLFDVYPEPLRQVFPFQTPPLDNGSFGRFVYSRNATQFGFNGGYYFLNLSANF